MIIIRKSVVCAIMLSFLAIGLACITYAENIQLWTYADPENPLTRIDAQTAEDEQILFLPSSMSLDSVPLFFEDEQVVLSAENADGLPFRPGDVADLTSFLVNDGTEASLVLTASDGTCCPFTVMKSENLDAIFLISSDPENAGRDWVEDSPDHSRKTTGSMVLLTPTGKTIYSGKLTQIRGRGNTSWSQPKRPYQIKLDKKTDLLRTGDKSNAAKTWLLLANYLDASLIRNSLVYDLSRGIGLTDTPEYVHTDLWYDGEYRGSYQLIEKVEIKSGRVEIRELESEIEDINPDYDFDAPVTVLDTTPWDTPMQYVEGLVDPADITGGYLLEMENAYRIGTETSWFQTRQGDYLFVNSPEAVSREALLYIAELYQAFEDAVFNGGTNPDTGRHYTEYMDLESLVRCYAVMEVSGNSECFINSTFFYKDAADDSFFCGPMWDYDLSMSNNTRKLCAGNTNLGKGLLALSDFRERVQEVYTEELFPLLRSCVADDGRIDDYHEMLAASARMNYRVWPFRSYYGGAQAGDGFEENLLYVREYLDERSVFLKDRFLAPPPRFADVQLDDWYYDYVENMAEHGLMTGMDTAHFSPSSQMTRGSLVTVLYRLAGAPDAGICPFPDVDDGAYYSSAVTWAAEQGIVLGKPDGRFYPDDSITRQDLVTILYRMAGSPAMATGEVPFEDGAEVADYAKDAVRWASKTGILQGDTLGHLRPRAMATRAECAKILTVYLEAERAS